MSYKQEGYLEHIKNKIGNRKICIYPMGIAGKAMLDKLKDNGIEIDFFSDKNPKLTGTIYKGKPCISQDELANKNQDEVIVIIESLYYEEIKNELLNSGIKNILRVFPGKVETEQFLEKNTVESIQERVHQVSSLLKDEQSRLVLKHITDSWFDQNIADDYFQLIYEGNQYIVSDIVKFEEDEIFVDVGAYIGDTAEIFLKVCNGKFQKMHLFELDPQIYTTLCENMKELGKGCEDKIVCHPFGLSDRNETISIVAGDSNSRIESGGAVNAISEIRRLDTILNDEKITFLKMDIEGAELSALRGAEKTIKKYLPKLAICIYHKPEDYFEIPIYIKELSDVYDIYIRHHTDLEYETVCYAIPRKIESSAVIGKGNKIQ